MTGDSADVALADTVAWVAVHGLTVAAAGLTLAAWLLWLHSPHRHLRRSNAELRRDNARLRAELALADQTFLRERQNAVEATWLAQQAQQYAAEVVADRDREIQHIEDRLQCALLELGTDWETQP